MKHTKYQQINAARQILQLPETATMAEIKSGYRRLLAKWHPDTSGEDAEKCTGTYSRVGEPA